MGFDKAKAISAAEKYLAQGKIPSAISEYRRIVERDPNDYSALNTLGDLYARTQKTQDAIECFQRVADHYREQGFTLKAIAVYKKISRLDPNLPVIASRLAVLYEQQGHFVEAREQYLAIADAYARDGRVRDSLAALRRSADLEPGNIEIRLRLGEGFLGEDLHEEAADAFTEAGERLLARGDAERALKAYTQAHNLRPLNHAVLHGLVAAHSKLGASDEAAAALEQAVSQEPKDVELRAMLSRAYLESEDAPAAERSTVALVELEASNYPQLFEVARLYLRRGDVGAAVGVLARTTEAALAGRQEQKLLGLLNEALARDPEQIEALRLLLRIYTWQRDDDRMRVTLERLAEAAQTHNLHAEERRALEHLVRLVPFDQSYHERLHELGEASADEQEDEAATTWYEPPVEENAAADTAADAVAAPHASHDDDVPTFEDVFERTSSDPFAATQTTPLSVDAGVGASEFEWNSVAMPEAEEAQAQEHFGALPEEPVATIDPNSSFADLNEDFAGAETASWSSGASATRPPAFEMSDLNSFDVSALAPEKETGEGRIKVLLAQELESVDYYLAQGYSDIARDTLDMLERQYGANEEISKRRSQLPHEADKIGVLSTASGLSSSEFESFAPIEEITATETAAEEVEIGEHMFISTATEEEVAAPPPVAAAPPSPVASSTVAPTPTPQPPSGLPSELADMFDEFRDEVEASDPAADAGDYETHYNTGIAYREMGLVDQAVEELQAAIALAAPHDGTPRYLQCCNLLGHCFMQKDMPRPAAMWFKKGLDTPGHSEDEYQALRYELGAAYEQMGDLERAIEVFSEVYGTDVNYRGVASKLRDLQTRKAVTSDK
ncbi:MAG TPA: tetratricopeptide repeat protein [Pyrinomonadaceae bacterium]|nr:tetratricopeptide repeat protein [Pyrinomonadaceae bacterium]